MKMKKQLKELKSFSDMLNRLDKAEIEDLKGTLSKLGAYPIFIKLCENELNKRQKGAV